MAQLGAIWADGIWDTAVWDTAIWSQTPVVNSSPTDITLTRNYVRVDAGLNAVLGVLDAVDVDTGDTHTFTLVAGTGDTNNASFNISGSNLRCSDPATLGIGTYSVRIQADDGTSTPFAKALTVEVLAAITGYGFIGAAVRPVTETVTESVTE